MEGQNVTLFRFCDYPFEFLNERDVDRNKKMEKWNKVLVFAYFFLYLQLLICCVQPASCAEWDGVIVTEADFEVLQEFKSELIDPKGFLRSWNGSSYGACSGGWIGIKCAQGQVIVIQLPWKGLGGKITEKIGQLHALRKLSLHDNVIGGEIPQSLGLLPNLRGLQLFNNRFSGSIPPSLGLSPALQTLDLSNNLLTGKIPDSISNSTKLYRLNLSFNLISGSIPSSLSRSPSLIFLALQRNNLSGSLSDSWGPTQNNPTFFQLQYLSLDRNSISGTIPASLGRLSELREVSFGHNQITGPIPDSIGRLSRLRTLDLSNNSINGSLPVSLSNLSSLVVLNLESNRLDTQIPEFLYRLHNLSVLNLRRNQFNGEIPSSIGNISTLRMLDFSQNDLSGEIPYSISNLKSLSFLNVSYNNLSGPVPLPLTRKFNSSSFVGNLQLCGYSSSTPCPSAAPPPSFLPAEKSRKHHRKLSTKDIILIAAGALLTVLFILFLVLLCCLIRKKAAASRAKNGEARGAAVGTQKGVPPGAREVEGGGEGGGKLVHFDGPLAFTADDLLCATAEIMGKSTYGTVYKATLEDGNQVAVKRLREKITKGQKEFESEVNLLGKIRHPNLLALRAYYLGPKGEKLLVFDYMPKGSLATFLHGKYLEFYSFLILKLQHLPVCRIYLI